MDRRRIRVLARIGLYVVAASMAYMAVWIAWMLGDQVSVTRGSVHVLVALGVAIMVGSPAGWALAMLSVRDANQ